MKNIFCLSSTSELNLQKGKVLFFNESAYFQNELQIKYFGDTTEKQIFIKSMVEAGEIKKEDAWEELEKITNMGNDNFMVCLKELQNKLGNQIVRGTLVMRDNEISAWDVLEDKEESLFLL